MAYQGAREASRLWSRGGPLLELGFVRIHLVGVVRLEGVVVPLLPLRLHVGLKLGFVRIHLVGVVRLVAGVAALLLLLDLVL